MASIVPRDGKFQIKWRERGRQRSHTCPDRRTAKEVLREIERCVARGEPWQPRTAREEPDIDRALRDYVLMCKRALAPRTALRYAQELDLFRRFLTDRLGKRPVYLDALTQSLLAELWEWADKGLHGNARSTSTKRKLLQGVQRWWRWCAEQDELEEWTPKPRRLRLPRAPRAPTVAPTWAEMDQVVNAFTNWRRRLAIVLRFTGLRVGQVMRLTWDDVDLDRAILRVRPELGKTDMEKQGRVVPISAHLVAELASWERSAEGWLVEVGEAVKGRERAARAEMMRRAWKRAGVREEVWRQRPQHAFRKGLRSGLRKLGADSEAIEYLLGHDLGIVGVYTDPDALPLRAAVKLIPPVGG